MQTKVEIIKMDKNIVLKIYYESLEKDLTFSSLQQCHEFLFNEYMYKQKNIKALRGYYEGEEDTIHEYGYGIINGDRSGFNCHISKKSVDFSKL